MELIGEPSWKLLVALLFLAFFSGLHWKTRPGKASLAFFLSALMLLGLVLFCGWLIVTDPEKVRARLSDMALAANQRDWQRMTKGFSEGFKTHGGMDRAAISAKLSGLEKSYGVKRVVLRQIQVGPLNTLGSRNARFTLRLEGAGGEMEIVEVEAVLNKKGGDWFLDGVKVFRALGGGSEPLPI